MRIMRNLLIILMNLLIIPIGGGIFFVVACVLETIIFVVLGFETQLGTGFGVPFRFFAFGLPMMGSDYFSAANLLLDWLIWCLVWCLVFVPLFYAVRALIRWYL
jgi:hypothetical protein